MKRIYLTIALLLAFGATSFAQDDYELSTPKWSRVTDWNKKPRLEDHFWRRKVRMRVDLQEKVNKPLESAIGAIYDEDSKKRYSGDKDQYFMYRRGIINALLSGYANELVDGYSPDSLNNKMGYMQFKAEYDKQTSETGETGGGGGGGDDFFGGGDDFGGFDDFGGDGFDFDMEDEGVSDGGDDVIPMGEESGASQFDKMTKNFAIIEDRIFDESKGSMYYDIQYIILSVNNAAGITTPIVAFKYEDVKDVILDKCWWRNTRNDAEFKTAKEIFEFRHFNYIIIDISGFPTLTVDEAEKRRLQLMEYEHNLWTF